MNQHAILQSNLLDIIFENRNKEYGAYTLRKSYNGRMRTALIMVMGICLLFCLLIAKHPAVVLTLRNTVVSIPDPKIAEFQRPPGSEIKVMINATHPKKTIKAELPPEITDSVNINKSPATPVEALPSLNSTGVSTVDFPRGDEGSGKLKTDGEIPVVLPAAKVNKPGPLPVAEIMPQYPGGIKALLDFLKKNLHAPEEVSEGDEVTVEIKFVVNYNGKLESFDVLHSGGATFDSEVVRVLKKMPLWIPGKSNGENVSVYYIVPVKFTSEF